MSSGSNPQFDQLRTDFDMLRGEIGKVVVGHEEVVDGLLTAWLAGGHVLLEGISGVGKTLLVGTLADVVELTFQRIQCTPDLMPADVIGTHVVMETPQGRRTFEFQRGPLFAHIVLVDQVNRTMPKTQSALLEAMESQSVTVSVETFDLPQPFLLVAAQNSLEVEGAYPLPDAQLDRFFFKLSLRPPGPEQLEAILRRTTEPEPPETRKVFDTQRLVQHQGLVRQVSIEPELLQACVSMVAATQPDHDRAPESIRRFVRYGAGPRGAQAMVLGAKARAAITGRASVSVDDLHAVVHPALRHRLILNFQGQADNVPTDDLINDVLKAVN